MLGTSCSDPFFFFHIPQNEEICSNSSSESRELSNNLELSFEYLMAKNQLKWITIYSEQSMLMSVCLQSIVDELLNQKNGSDINNIQVSLWGGHLFRFCVEYDFFADSPDRVRSSFLYQTGWFQSLHHRL